MQDPSDKLPKWAPTTSPARTLLLKFMTSKDNIRNDDHHNHSPADNQDDEHDQTVDIAPHEEGDKIPFNIFPYSNYSTPPPSPPPHISCLDTPSLKLYGSGKRSRSVKLGSGSKRSRSIRSDEPFSAPLSLQNRGEETGISITWKDLWVTVPAKKVGRRPILLGLTGYVQPAQCLAIMGPSGCGKSTLLDTLAGRLGSNTQQKGDILINGRKQTLAFGTSAYVTQDDTLMTTLTVREAVYYSAQLQLPDSMSRSEKKERAETTIRDMGLQDAMDMRIGGWTVKGISGGQKRRVSICIEILTRPKLLFLDEPTSGLDSAASYHVMNSIIKLAQQDRRTVIASLHQPSGEVFDLFHNLCLLSSGKLVYFGATFAANEFFALNGFPCPAMRNPSDHFLRTVNRDFDIDIEQGHGGKVSATEAIDILVKSFKSSETYQQVQDKVFEINQKNYGPLEQKGSQASFITHCKVLTRRSFINMYRDLGYYWLRLTIYLGLGLCVGSIFHDIGNSYGSIQARGSMLAFTAGFLTFMAIGGFPSFVEDMKIFTRERLNGHYGVAAFVVGNTMSSVPYLFLISLIPGVVSYYLVGLQKDLGHFVYFVLLLLACLLLVESLMMMVASIVPDYLMGIISGAGIQGVMMLNGGFFRLPNDLPKPVWKYPMNYVAFHTFAFGGLYKNEFLGLTFVNEKAGGPPIITGAEILRDYWQVNLSYSKWVDLGIVFGMLVLYRLMFFGIIKFAENVKPMIRAFMRKSGIKAEDPSSIKNGAELGCSVRRVRAFSVLDCNCYTVDLTFQD